MTRLRAWFAARFPRLCVMCDSAAVDGRFCSDACQREYVHEMAMRGV